MKKAALHNLGCKVNAYETGAMQEMLLAHGYQIVPFTEQADVYVINTCTVTNMADRKSRQMLHRAKKRNPNSIVVATGCYVQTSAEQAQADTSIDIMIGNNKKHELISMLEAFAKKQEAENQIAELANMEEETVYEELIVTGSAEHTRAFLKIQDGCDQFCSYCIIPYARGRIRSRGAKSVRKEVEQLARNGYREIVLTGIHLSSYGADTGDSLLNLIQSVHEVDGIRRIRLGSLEPKIITEEFAGTLSGLKKVCPHFHLSLQSGCDGTLRRMNRKYTCEEYKKGCELLRKYFEHPAITTDIIVGFPGETEEEFETTRKFLTEIGFFEIHIFKYSVRKGTKAENMIGQVPEAIKTERSNILFRDVEGMSDDFVQWYQGKEVEVLVEEKTNLEEGVFFVGHTEKYIKVAVASEENLVNKMIRGTVRNSRKNHILLLDGFLSENID